MPHDAYIRLSDCSLERIRDRAGGRAIEVDDAKPYCRVRWDSFGSPDEWLRDVSESLGTEILWLVVQKQADALAFHRWVGGDLKRCLSYGVQEERTWERVVGLPEPWEADVLFSPRSLERRLKVLQIIEMPAGDAEEAEQGLRRVWAERLIRVGEGEPAVSVGFAGPAIARHYNLPGW